MDTVMSLVMSSWLSYHHRWCAVVTSNGALTDVHSHGDRWQVWQCPYPREVREKSSWLNWSWTPFHPVHNQLADPLSTIAVWHTLCLMSDNLEAFQGRGQWEHATLQVYMSHAAHNSLHKLNKQKKCVKGPKILYPRTMSMRSYFPILLEYALSTSRMAECSISCRICIHKVAKLKRHWWKWRPHEDEQN